MSVASVQNRIAEVQAKINGISQKPDQMFRALLQEKLGVSTTGQAASEPQDGAVGIRAQAGDVLSTAASVLQSSSVGYDPSCPLCAAGASQGYSAVNAAWTAATLPEGFEKAAPYMQYVEEASQRYGMPVNLILGVMRAESDFNNECVSSAGAKGLMQLMPETAAEVGVTDEFDPRQNILGSVEYITKLINRYNGDVRLALTAYNTGPGKIASRNVTSSASAEYLTVPQSIRDYADRVLTYAGYQA